MTAITAFQVLELVFLGGIAGGVLKAVVMTGRLLQKLEDHDTTLKDHGGRIHAIETHLMGRKP